MEIRYQDFDPALCVQCSYLSNRFGPVCVPGVYKIVSINRSDNGVRQVQVLHGFGHVMRLLRIKQTRNTFTDGAEPAVSSANVSAKHESGGSIRPALKNVRTPSFLANRVKIQTFDQFHHVVLI